LFLRGANTGGSHSADEFRSVERRCPVPITTTCSHGNIVADFFEADVGTHGKSRAGWSAKEIFSNRRGRAVMFWVAIVAGWFAIIAALPVLAAPPATQTAIETQANVDARLAELQTQMQALPADSADRARIATEILALKQKRKQFVSPTPAEVRPDKAANVLPSWAMDLVRRNHKAKFDADIENITRSLDAEKRELAAAKANLQSVPSRESNSAQARSYRQNCEGLQKKIDQDNTQLAELRNQSRDEEEKLKQLPNQIAAKYPRGVMRCSKCRGTGKITSDVANVPSVARNNRRGGGGNELLRDAACEACDGVGLVERDAEYEQSITAVTSAQIKQKREAAKQQWESYLQSLSGNATHGDQKTQFGANDEMFFKEIRHLPKDIQSKRVSLRLSKISTLPDLQVVEIIVDDARAEALLQERIAQRAKAMATYDQHKPGPMTKFPDWNGPWKMCPVCQGTGHSEASRVQTQTNIGPILGQVAGTGGSARIKNAIVYCEYCGGTGQVPDYGQAK
jgi:DnaJ-class molecular chaperone